MGRCRFTLIQKIASQNREDRIAEANKLSEMIGELDQLKISLCDRINRISFGGAVGLLSCCDIVVSVEESLFSLIEGSLGLLLATISPYELSRIGASSA